MNLYDSSMLRDAQIEAAFAQKKFKWRFDPELEKDFDAFREIRLLRAIVPIGWSGLIIFALYSILDYVYFPPSLYPITILIRLSFICPLIAFALWCSTKTWRYKQFLTLYAGVFTLCGLGIIAIIYAAHAQGVMVPYDGLLLMLMFGFFLMELPFIWINSIAWGLTAVYVLMEIQVGFPSSQLISNLFFLITGNVLGGIGSLFQEQSLRKQFLQETLIARSRDALQKESEAKTRLLTAASHDLRQPLHAMTLITEDLQEQIQGEQEQAHLLQLKAAIDNLDQLLNSVLDISKLSVGMISAHKRAISIKSLSLQLQRSLLFDANLKKIDLRVVGGADLSIDSDPIILLRILRNLIENALKHAEASRILISWKSIGDYCRVMISDNGKGIPQDQHHRIFEEFQQLSENASAGMGLGLAIVKQLCNLLNLSMGIQSSRGQGATFWLDIPIISLPQTDESSNPFDSPSRREIRGNINSNSTTEKYIVVLDDQPEIAKDTAKRLENWGYVVTPCTSVSEAIKVFEKQIPDIFITDYHLSKKENGIRVLQIFRKEFNTRLPTLLVTADHSIALSEEIPDLILAHKPLAAAKLRLMINHLLQ